jgi:hypothetical protein
METNVSEKQIVFKFRKQVLVPKSFTCFVSVLKLVSHPKRKLNLLTIHFTNSHYDEQERNKRWAGLLACEG